MSFDKFPLDQQRCLFRVGSYSYDTTKMIFSTKSYGYGTKGGNSIALDYEISKQNLVKLYWADLEIFKTVS